MAYQRSPIIKLPQHSPMCKHCNFLIIPTAGMFVLFLLLFTCILHKNCHDIPRIVDTKKKKKREKNTKKLEPKCLIVEVCVVIPVYCCSCCCCYIYLLLITIFSSRCCCCFCSTSSSIYTKTTPRILQKCQ